MKKIAFCALAALTVSAAAASPAAACDRCHREHERVRVPSRVDYGRHRAPLYVELEPAPRRHGRLVEVYVEEERHNGRGCDLCERDRLVKKHSHGRDSYEEERGRDSYREHGRESGERYGRDSYEDEEELEREPKRGRDSYEDEEELEREPKRGRDSYEEEEELHPRPRLRAEPVLLLQAPRLKKGEAWCPVSHEIFRKKVALPALGPDGRIHPVCCEDCVRVMERLSRR